MQVLAALYGARADPTLQRQAHGWLLDVQGSADAWPLALQLLACPVRLTA